MQRSQKNLIWAKENTRSSRIPQLPNIRVHVTALRRISKSVNQLKQHAAFTAIWIILFNITPEQTVAAPDWKNPKQQTAAAGSWAELQLAPVPGTACLTAAARTWTGQGVEAPAWSLLTLLKREEWGHPVVCRVCCASPQGWLRMHVP